MNSIQRIAAGSALMLCLSSASAFAAATPSKTPKVQLEEITNWQLPAKPLDMVYSLDQKRVFILTDQSVILAYTAAGDLLGKIKVEKGVSAIDISPRGEKLFLLNYETNKFTDLAVSFVMDIDIAGSPFLGKDDAPVVIAVFTDFE